MNLPMPFQPAGGGKVLPTSLVGTPEEWLICVLALMGSQLLVLLKGLLATFKTALLKKTNAWFSTGEDQQLLKSFRGLERWLSG